MSTVYAIRAWGIRSGALLALGSACSHQLPAQSAASVVGEWVFEMVGDAQPQRVNLTAAGDTIRGRVYGQALAGTMNGRVFRFSVGSYQWRGTLSGDSLSGWIVTDTDSSQWTAQRYRKPATARRYTLTPTTYHRGVSNTAAPALRLHAGDTVHTTTVDAGGWGTGAFGEKGNKRTDGGNPLTGPFYVEGAVPGDVLVVRLLRVRLNRPWAFSGTSLVDNAITPSYATERKQTPTDNKWTLDTAAGVARLTSPTAGLSAFTVPLTPFLGVVAVAPGGSWTPSSRDAGSYGGNLEYSQLREGTTLYLPVSTMGAYLYLGDGHAAQGDGELTGDAMETSLDVTFTVDVKRWGFASIPRAETADHLMSIGTGGSLDEAMRQATTDLARWLEADYTLTANEVAILMGFAVRFDIPDVVPPSFGVSARLPKVALQSIKRRR
ncbi:acetamidase/formamidase family protein [Gemmatimonas sp.]|uniref:acetamidase/formamidase family protein n=1 Tax=Gemmatimonas sp. TaxID=1962908 RepID=UPI0033429DAE